MGSLPPPSCPITVSSYPSLTNEQVGHIRHIHNLSLLLDGQWTHMGAQEPRQEFLDAYRYQLATMAYTISVTHYHRGVRTDPSLTVLRAPWADPIVRENIMYSGHLLLMVSLYAMLFDDDEFEKEGNV
ncbi:hypothetical protein LTR49_002030 [Elasticomyces elasticus]|nr:hypothetical protein LTR49_002030 [Elasticomyces elasticus]